MYHLSEDDDDDILLYGWCHPKERKGQTTNSIELLDKSQATHHLRGRFPNAKEDCWYKQCIPRTISFMTMPKLTPECQGKAVLCIIWIERISKHFCVWDYAYDRFSIESPGSIYLPYFWLCFCVLTFFKYHMHMSLPGLVLNYVHLCVTWSLASLQSYKMLIRFFWVAAISMGLQNSIYSFLFIYLFIFAFVSFIKS